MGRYFLTILMLQTLGKLNIFIQELFFDDLSLPYYEVKFKVERSQKSIETNFCQIFGGLSIFTSFLSQFYCLWMAVLIKQILKDPIHRLNRYIYFYNFLTFLISVVLTAMIYATNSFGVEVSISCTNLLLLGLFKSFQMIFMLYQQETLQCGLMTTLGLDDELLMFLPFFLIPLQVYLIAKIMRETPFLVKKSVHSLQLYLNDILQLKSFVRKYSIAMFFLMFIKVLQVVLIVYGSSMPSYFADYELDGFANLRYVSALLKYNPNIVFPHT